MQRGNAHIGWRCRSPTGHAGNTDKQLFDSDFQIGDRMKISKKHAEIYWNHEEENWMIKSICKNAVRVDGIPYPGSSTGTDGKPAKLQSKSAIEIADGTPIFFLLPKGTHSLEKPKQTYEQLISSVLEGGQLLTLQEIISEIQKKYPYYAEQTQQEFAPTF